MQNPFDQFDSQPQAPAARGPMVVGTPRPEKPRKPEIREVGGQLGLVDPETGAFTPTYTPPPKPGKEGGNDLAEGERKGGAFLKRALGAYKNYEALGVGPRGVVNNVVNNVSPTLANNLPEMLGGNDANRQQATAAEEEFLTAILRQDSGATITPDELESQRRIYFPMPGETSKEVLESKRQARLRALQGIMGAAGNGADPETSAAIQALLEPQAPAPKTETELATGETRMEANPKLQGVNAEIGKMLAGGQGNGPILKLLRERGATTEKLMEINGLLNEWRKYKAQEEAAGREAALPEIDLERQEVQNGLWNQLASSGPAAAALAAADTLTGGHLDNIVGMTGGDAEQANLGIQLSREKEPEWSLGGDIVGGIGAYMGGAGALRAAGMAPAAAGRVGALSPRALAGDAALGGYVASGQGGTQAVDFGNVAQGAVLGAGAGAATRGALNTVGAAISPTGGSLAPLYEAGVRPTLGQRLGASETAMGRAANRGEQAFASVPMVGGVQRSARNAAVVEMQTGAFNEALKEIGAALPQGVQNGPAAHRFMQNAFNQAYAQARSGMQVVPDQQFAADLATLSQDVQLLSRDSQSTFRNIARGLVETKLRAGGGRLAGDQYKMVVSRIDKKIASLRSNPNGDTELADALESLRTTLDDSARRNSPPEFVEALDAADRGYAKSVVIENAARLRGGNPGEFNGNQLDRAVQATNKSRRSRAYLRGEAVMQDYATAAKQLGDEVPDSGTPERLMTMGGLAGLAHFVDPVALTPWAIDTVATLPGVRQGLGSLMAPRSPAMRGRADRLRDLSQRLGRYGAPTAIPGVTE